MPSLPQPPPPRRPLSAPLMGRLSSLQRRVVVAVYTVAISVHENAMSRKANGGGGNLRQ